MSGRHRRDRVPLHIQDQVDAAEVETNEVLGATAARIKAPVNVHHDHDGTDPVLDAMLDQIRAVAESGQLRGCRHAGNPQPLMIDFWRRPWVMRCGPCQIALPPVSFREDHTCDNCGTYDPTGVWPTQIALGAVMVTMGRCDNCIPVDKRPTRKGG